MSLGERIYELRSGKGMSQGELADKLDVSRQAVSKWENNSAVPDLDKLLKISELFSVSLDELVKGNCQPKEICEKGENSEKRTAATHVAEEKPRDERLPARKIFAFIFFGLTLLTCVLSLCTHSIDVLTLCIPFIGFGLICWFSKNFAGLNCLWFAYILFQYFSIFMLGGLNFSVYAIRLMLIDINYLFTGLAALAVVIVMIVVTVLSVKGKPIKKPQSAGVRLIGGWAAFVVYFLITLTVGPYLTDLVVISSGQNETLGAVLQLLSFSDNLAPTVILAAAISFTVRYTVMKRNKAKAE